MRASWVAALAVLSACGDDDPIPFPLTGAQFHADFDLANGLNQCNGDGVLQFTGSGSQVAGTLTAELHCNGEDTELSGSITSGTLDGTHVTFTVETEPALCTFTGEEGRDGLNEELRGSVECQYGDDRWTGLFVAFRDVS
jgi:hypothetical protein